MARKTGQMVRRGTSIWLNMMGIEPLGALERTSMMVEKRFWRARVEDAVVTDAGRRAAASEPAVTPPLC